MVTTLFIVSGSLALGLAAALLFTGFRPDGRRDALLAVLWACRGAGLIIQAGAPNLKVKNGMVVVPVPTAPGPVLNVHRTVEREKWMEIAALLLTAGASVGLARS